MTSNLSGVWSSWLCIILYWCWIISWQRGGWCARRKISDWWFYSEIAIGHLLYGAGCGYLLRWWGIL